MNHIKRISILSAAVLPVLFLGASSASAQTMSITHLSDNQKVIIKQKIKDGDAQPIGKSGYYVASIKTIKKSFPNGNVNIYPILSYRPDMTVNDPLELQGYLNLLGAPTFWDSAPDASSKTVALIDGGVALSHVDLSGRWVTNPSEMGATTQEGPAPNCTSRGLMLDKSCNNLDDDGNGFVDDWRGWDFANSDNDPQAGTTNPTSEYASHGTEVAGLIGLTGNNAIGAASLNWTSKILPLQIFTDDGSATTVEVANAISYAISHHVDVINLSLGTTSVDPTIDSLITQAKNAGIVVVAAAGNCGGSNYSLNGCDYEGQMLYPATNNNVIAVGATDLSDVQAYFSSRGNTLDIVAPGDGAMISSTYTSANPTSAYSNQLYGTSFATPIVSGLVASLKAAWPNATNNDIRDMLVDTALKTAGMSGSVSTDKYGFGRIQPVKALSLANKCKNITLAADINCDGSINLLDLSLLASQWQKQYTGRTDENASGLVDLLDLSILASQWGK